MDEKKEWTKNFKILNVKIKLIRQRKQISIIYCKKFPELELNKKAKKW